MHVLLEMNLQNSGHFRVEFNHQLCTFLFSSYNLLYLFCVSGGPVDVSNTIYIIYYMIYRVLYMCVCPFTMIQHTTNNNDNCKDQQQKSYIHNQMIYAHTQVKVYIFFVEQS